MPLQILYNIFEANKSILCLMPYELSGVVSNFVGLNTFFLHWRHSREMVSCTKRLCPFNFILLENVFSQILHWHTSTIWVSWCFLKSLTFFNSFPYVWQIEGGSVASLIGFFGVSSLKMRKFSPLVNWTIFKDHLIRLSCISYEKRTVYKPKGGRRGCNDQLIFNGIIFHLTVNRSEMPIAFSKMN